MTISSVSGKSADAFRTISEVAETLKLPQHVLRFWETRFTQIRPLKRAGNRRFYRPEDIELLGAIRQLLYGEGYTIKGVQRILREQGPRAVAALARHHEETPGAPRHDLAEETDGIEPLPDEEAAEPAVPFAEATRPPAPLPTSLPWEPAPVAAAPRAAGEGDLVAQLESVLAEIEACRRLLDDACG